MWYRLREGGGGHLWLGGGGMCVCVVWGYGRMLADPKHGTRQE